MFGKQPSFEDEIIDAVLEDERAALISQLRGDQLDDEGSWLSLA
jgi:hypothetical protein